MHEIICGKFWHINYFSVVKTLLNVYTYRDVHEIWQKRKGPSQGFTLNLQGEHEIGGKFEFRLQINPIFSTIRTKL